ALSRQIGRLTPAEAAGSATSGHETRTAMSGAASSHRWRFYCESVAAAALTARAGRASVLVVSQPYISDGHGEQQEALRRARHQSDADPHVAYLDGGRAIDLKNQRLAFDGMHLTPEGNRTMADALASRLAQLKPAFSR